MTVPADMILWTPKLVLQAFAGSHNQPVNHLAQLTGAQYPAPLAPVGTLHFEHQGVLKLNLPAGGQFALQRSNNAANPDSLTLNLV